MSDPRRLSRRDLLRLSAGSLLAAGLWPGALRAEGVGTSKEFHFVVVNDTHYIDKPCGDWLERVVARMKAHEPKIDFCLHLGDVADHGQRDELEPSRDIFKALGVPIHYVPGNHDHKARDDRKAYEETFPKSLNQHFEHGGWQFVGLDTTDGVGFVRTTIQKPTLTWLDEAVPKLDKKKPTIVFTHFPLGPRLIQRPLNTDDVLNRFKEYNLRTVFCGHHHALTERPIGEVLLTTNRCCAFSRPNHDGSKEKGYFLCRVKDGKVTHTFVEVKTA